MFRLARFSLCFLGVAFAVYSPAQTTNAVIVGDITDAQNAVVVGAKIDVKDIATGVTRTVQSDQSGQYRVFPLLPGTYDVTVSAPGFRSKAQTGVKLDLASQAKVDFQLDVGQVQESVEVTSSTAVLQTQDASVGGVVTGTELAHMPVNGRNYTRLILMMPGTSDRGGSQNRGTQSGTSLYSVNGQRQQDNNYTVDGIDSNIYLMNSPGGSPPMDSIQEFKVLNNTSAEFGRSA